MTKWSLELNLTDEFIALVDSIRGETPFYDFLYQCFDRGFVATLKEARPDLNPKTAKFSNRQASDALRDRLSKSASEKEVSAAARRLATFGKRHGLSLGGSIKDLLHESRP
jgi:hypothetical protein